MGVSMRPSGRIHGRRGAWWRAVGISLGAVLTASCAAIPLLVPPMLDFAANLIATAAKNYSSGYADIVTRPLLEAVSRPYTTSGGWPPGAPGSNDPRYPVPGAQPGYPMPPDPRFPQAGGPCGVYPNPPCPGGQPWPPGAPDPGYPMAGGQTGSPVPSDPRYQTPGTPGGAPPGSPGMGGIPSQPTATPLTVDLALLKKTVAGGRTTLVPIPDGEVLRDGRGNPQAGDKFKVVFRANADCYVYIVSIDGSAWAQGLFPSKHASASNPVSAHREYMFPEGHYWHSLDQFRGIETIYVVASLRPRPDIEAILAQIAGRERHPSATPLQVEQPAVIPFGFGGTRPGPPASIPVEAGQVQQVMTTTFYPNPGDQDLRITRWFRHE